MLQLPGQLIGHAGLLIVKFLRGFCHACGWLPPLGQRPAELVGDDGTRQLQDDVEDGQVPEAVEHQPACVAHHVAERREYTAEAAHDGLVPTPVRGTHAEGRLGWREW